MLPAGWLAILQAVFLSHYQNMLKQHDGGNYKRNQREMIPALDGSSHGHEGLLHVGSIFRTSLHERDADLISERLHWQKQQ